MFDDTNVLSQVQSRLNALDTVSPPLPVDGVPSASTTEAIRKFQSARGLTPNGMVNDQTLTALGVPFPASPPANPDYPYSRDPSYPVKSGVLSQAKARLNALGVASPALVVDERDNALTTAAIERFQSSKGITPDGALNARTLAALGISANPDYPYSRDPSYPVNSGVYAQAQVRLNALEIVSPRLPEDGVPSDLTSDAIRKFQSSRGITPDGALTDQTLAALRIPISSRFGTSDGTPPTPAYPTPPNPPNPDLAQVHARLSSIEATLAALAIHVKAPSLVRATMGRPDLIPPLRALPVSLQRQAVLAQGLPVTVKVARRSPAEQGYNLFENGKRVMKSRAVARAR